MDELDYKLALWRVLTIGPIAYQQIAQRIENWSDLLNRPYDTLKKIGLSKHWLEKWSALLSKPNWSGVEKDRCWLDASKQHFILQIGDQGYPVQLASIHDAPPLLFVEGHVQALNRSALLAMVGSRKASVYGLRLASHFACALAAYEDISIVSGLAYGIDTASHRSVVEQNGCAIAVLANGLDLTYPQCYRPLREQIAAAGGAIVSEFPCGVTPRPYYFPRRNRIISSLSHGVLVVESCVKSGSLITARLAVEQGRDVLTIPGSINQQTVQGNHCLLRQGAILVRNVADVIEHFPSLLRQGEKVALQRTTSRLSLKGKDDSQDWNLLEKTMGKFPIGELFTPDDIVAHSGLTVDKVCSMLLQLQLQKEVERVAGGFIRCEENVLQS